MFSDCLPSQVTVAGRAFSITKATKNDVRPIVELLSDDVLGVGRESWQENAEDYKRAFDLIEASPDNALLTVREARGASSEESGMTTDKTRTDAHRFYDRLGFEATHEGYKIIL